MSTSPNNLPDSIDVMNRLRITSCPTCGVIFALPQQLWSQCVNDGSEIFCPSGCHIELRDTEETRGSLAILNVELLAQITQTKHELETARDRIARLPHPPQAPISAEELSRRIELTASRASHIKGLDPICLYCGKPSSNRSSLRAHLMRKHAEAISNLPASCFD